MGSCERYGYDIQWQHIVETDWDLFTRFVNKTCDISVHNATLKPDGRREGIISLSQVIRTG